MKCLTRWRNDRRFKKLVSGRRFLNLGATEDPWPGFVTCGFYVEKVDFRQDATEPYPPALHDHFDFVWSERMLEHIDCADFEKVFTGLKTILRKEGRARFCLPVCFFGTPKINMVREGNAEKCRGYGHISWFTHEGFGPVTDEVFGLSRPPNQISTWEELLAPLGLRYVPVRHYDEAGDLFVDRSVMRDESPHPFVDRPEIELYRPDSLIFDIVHL